jgi:predicted HicB family RNase H-like nuclease
METNEEKPKEFVQIKLDKTVHDDARIAAIRASMRLQAWVAQAIREKLAREGGRS